MIAGEDAIIPASRFSWHLLQCCTSTHELTKELLYSNPSFSNVVVGIGGFLLRAQRCGVYIEVIHSRNTKKNAQKRVSVRLSGSLGS